MIEAIQLVNAYKNLIIIGCGLRLEDSILRLLITNFLQGSDWQKKKIIILDPDADNTKEKVKKYWSRKIFSGNNMIPIKCKLEERIDELIDEIRNNDS